MNSSLQNRNQPIQIVHGGIWRDTQFIFRKIPLGDPARPEPKAFGPGDIPEIRRYKRNRTVRHAQMLRNQLDL